MKILAVHPYIPYPLERGAYHRAFQLLRQLAKHHEVDLLALSENSEGIEHRKVFQRFCRRVEFVPFQHPGWEKFIPKRFLNPLPPSVAHWTIPELRAPLKQMLADGAYDYVQVCDIVLAQFFLKEHHEWPLIVDRTRVDLQYQLMEHRQTISSLKSRLLKLEAWVKLWRYERNVADRALLEIVCGPDDESFLRRHIRRQMPIQVIPNGVDLDYFHPEAAPDEMRAARPTILFCGAMDYLPNSDALRWYFAEMHETMCQLVPHLEVLIVGKAPTPEVQGYATRPNVTVTGRVPDVRPFYRRAWLQIVPLRIGGGTRLKIVESMAMKTPVVSTTIGAQGLGLRHGQDVLLADTAKEFIQQTVRALGSPVLRSALERTGFETVRRTLSWPMQGTRFCQAIESAM